MVRYFVWYGIEISWRVIFTSYKLVDIWYCCSYYNCLSITPPLPLQTQSPKSKPSSVSNLLSKSIHITTNCLLWSTCSTTLNTVSKLINKFRTVISINIWYCIIQTNAWATFIFLLADSLMYGSVCLSVCPPVSPLFWVDARNPCRVRSLPIISTSLRNCPKRICPLEGSAVRGCCGGGGRVTQGDSHYSQRGPARLMWPSWDSIRVSISVWSPCGLGLKSVLYKVLTNKSDLFK